jgi:hypothetical protein
VSEDDGKESSLWVTIQLVGIVALIWALILGFIGVLGGSPEVLIGVGVAGGFLALGVAYLVGTVRGIGGTSGNFQGHAYRIVRGVVLLDMPAHEPATLGRRELEEIASGVVSSRVGSFAAKAEFRRAVETLLASGRETILFLDAKGIRFEGYERGDKLVLLGALAKLAGPGFILSRHAGPGICPYCKETATEGTVRCERCGAEHHAECFTEHGGCAIFGCERAPSGRRSKENA